MSASGTTADVTITALTPGGDGLARHAGVPLAVPFTIPGERVRVRVGPVRGGQASAELLEVLSPSPHRVPAPCPHFGPCGGCTWQHIAYPEQLRLKRDLVASLVAATHPGRATRVRDVLPATALEDPWGYRHKVHFVFSSTPRGALVMGHYARGSRAVISVRVCPVHAPRGNALAFRFRDEAVRAGVTAASSRSGTLRHLVVRVGANTGETAATVVATTDRDKRLRNATRRAFESGERPDALHLNLHPRPGPLLFGTETRRIAGPERIRERVGGTDFLISPTAFFQTNVAAADILVRLVLEAVPPAANVLDLYAGAGLFALPLARRGQRVIGVEESRAAVEDGEASLGLNRISRQACRFIAGRVERTLARLRPADAVAVVLDPPREGCAPAVLEEVFGRLRPKTAVYVSCNPEALARELPGIERHGYALRSLQPVDMFPHTAHVETVAVLTR